MTEITIEPAMVDHEGALSTAEDPPRLLYKVAMVGPGNRWGAYYWTIDELRALRTALMGVVLEPSDDTPEAA